MSGIQIKAVAGLGIVALMAAGTCVSSSVVAANISGAGCASSNPKGRTAYTWAWTTAATSGVLTGLAVTGIVLIVAL